jgi:hypothetical protein
MAIPPDTQLDDPDTQRDLRVVWLACTGPCLWLSLLTVIYAVSDHECGRSTAPYSWALTGLGILGSAAALVALLRARREHELPAPHTPKRKAARVQTMIDAGLALNALSLVLLVGFLAPLVFLRPCE